MSRIKQYKSTWGNITAVSDFHQFQAEMVGAKLHPDGIDLKNAKKLMVLWNKDSHVKYELVEK